VTDLDDQRPGGSADPSGPLARRLAGLVERLGWRRLLLVRQVAAGVLVLAAVVLAVRAPGGGAGVPVLVAARELASGSTLHPADVTVRRFPPELVPPAALRTVDEADGQVLAGAAGPGEPLTPTRLAGPELAARATGGRDAASVPIRLADAGVAALLRPGRTVDVVTIGQRADQPSVLASAAVVLTVLPAENISAGRGRLVLVAVPRAVAGRLAAATLGQEVAVTLR
jgi:Flp pilus assembly protein CpaB